MKKSLFLLSAVVALSASAAHAQMVTRTITTTQQQAVPDNYCREYTQSFTIGKQTQTGYGTACLQPDGSWEIQPAADAAPQVAGGTTTETIEYVTRDDRVYMRPPEPFYEFGMVIDDHHGYGGYGRDRYVGRPGHFHR